MPVTQQQALDFGKTQLNTPVPQDGIVVFFIDSCSHCQHSLEATNMATRTTNGTPVKWLDINTPEGAAAIISIPGVSVNKEGDTLIVGGTSIPGFPTSIWIKNGVATEVVKVGPFGMGDLDQIVAQQQAKQPSKATGTTVPNTTPPTEKTLRR